MFAGFRCAVRPRAATRLPLPRMAVARRGNIRRLHGGQIKPKSKKGAAEKVNAALFAAEDNLSLRDHLMRLGLWGIVSLNVGFYFSQGDEGAQILVHLDEFTAAIMDAGTDATRLERILEQLSRGLAQNDSLKDSQKDAQKN